MSKADVNFTIGADGSAFSGALKKLHDPLSKIGEAFMGLQGVTAGLKTVFGGISGKAAEVENVAASLLSGISWKSGISKNLINSNLSIS
ncbi:MAG: hypothetical protein IKT79_02750 [Akkermansia sp.]|nr:hypothetical protein [Akkermansia sp.]